jgi:hypothetical protein
MDDKQLIATDEIEVLRVSARSLLRMTKQERERLMEQAASVVAVDYEDGGKLSGFESLAEEDHFDQSLPGESTAIDSDFSSGRFTPAKEPAPSGRFTPAKEPAPRCSG